MVLLLGGADGAIWREAVGLPALPPPGDEGHASSATPEYIRPRTLQDAFDMELMARLQAANGQEVVAVHKNLMLDSTLLIAKPWVEAKVRQSSYHPHRELEPETTCTYVSLELGQAIVPLFGVVLRSVKSWHISILYAGKFRDSDSNIQGDLNK